MIWALDRVSFEVEFGEVVGIIGRNGAGKTTLLKILSQITDPTCGYADVYGRVGSLLEVGTGFHQELTGRENIFLNGAILGMKRAEISRHFDEIVAFAEIGRFVDTTVKHYSTGMQARLAFAVAAHLNPEILFVDEVLAVGDAAFQRKCLGKMDEVAHSGRTVLFVSHNLAAVRSLCTRGLLLERGRRVYLGPIEEALVEYNRLLGTQRTGGSGQDVEFSDVRMAGASFASISCDQSFEILARVTFRKVFPAFKCFGVLQNESGEQVAVQTFERRDFPDLEPGTVCELRLRYPPLWLRPGAYSFYFKLLGDTLRQGKSRAVSDCLSMDVYGNAPGASVHQVLLTPRVDSHISAVTHRAALLAPVARD